MMSCRTICTSTVLRRSATKALCGAAALAVFACAAQAQAIRVRSQLRPKPNLFASGTLTVSATPGIVSFPLLRGGMAKGSSAVNITTSWNVSGLFPTLSLYAYLGSSTAALSDNRSVPSAIPSSAVLGQVPTGDPTAYTPFTGSPGVGAAGAGLTLLSNESLGLLGTFSGSRTDVLNLEIDLSGLPNLPAGTYTGTMTVQATAN